MSKNSRKTKKGGRNEGSIKKQPSKLEKWESALNKKNGRRVWRAFFRTLLFKLLSRILFEKLFPLRGRLDKPIARLQRRVFWVLSAERLPLWTIVAQLLLKKRPCFKEYFKPIIVKKIIPWYRFFWYLPNMEILNFSIQHRKKQGKREAEEPTAPFL